MTRWLRGATLAVALILLGAGCGGIQLREQDLFLPKPSLTPADFPHQGLTLTRHTIPAADTALGLDAWQLTKPGAERHVLFFGGNGFYLVQSRGYVDALARHPVQQWLVDYRGYGRSGGEPAVEALKADALQVYDYLVDTRGVAPQHLYVHGHSMGTFLALHVAESRPVRGVVLENPASSGPAWTKAVLPWYLRVLLRPKLPAEIAEEDNLSRIAQLDAPVLIIAGSADPITPPSMAEALYEAAPQDKRELLIVEGGGHNELYDDPAYIATYAGWWARWIEPDASTEGP
ncbi:MAG: alpha/beta fold hydrolase [Bacteroidota bacterium]